MNYKKTTLPNGLRIITVPMKGTNTAIVSVMVGAGSKNEEKHENGISHFLEHMTFKGTKKRPKPMQIATELDSVGGEQNAFTSFEMTWYYAKVSREHLNFAIDLVSDMSMNGLLDEKEIEKEKGTIIEEINMYEDLPSRRVGELFDNLVYGDQPAGWDIAGPKENIRKFKRDDFVKYKEEHYTTDNIVVVVAGNINNDTEEKVVSAFKDLPKTIKKNKIQTVEDKNRPKIALHFKKTNQSHFCLGGLAYNIFDERKIAAKVLACILGRGMSSRLWKVIRDDHGLAYYLGAMIDTATDTGTYVIKAGVDNGRVDKAIELSIEELKKIKNEEIFVKELRKAKEMIKGRLSIALESSNRVARWFAEEEILENKILTPEEYFAKIESVTAEQIQEVANDLFANDNLRLAMIGPHKDSAKFEKLLKI